MASSKNRRGNWTSLLRERSDVWFPAHVVEAVGIVQRGMRKPEERRRIAEELRAEAYTPPYPRPYYHSEDEWLLSGIFRELITALWPEPVAKALWDKDRELGPEDAEALVRFLEISPFFFRSGYMKPLAIKRLGWCSLTKGQRERIFEVLRRLVLGGWERQMGGWRKLGRFCDPQKLRELIAEALGSEKEAVVKRGTLLGLALLEDSKFLGEAKPWLGNWDRRLLSPIPLEKIASEETLERLVQGEDRDEEIARLKALGPDELFEELTGYWKKAYWAEATEKVRQAFAL